MSFWMYYLLFTGASLWFWWLILKEERANPSDITVGHALFFFVASLVPLLNFITTVLYILLYLYITPHKGLGRILRAKVGKTEESK